MSTEKLEPVERRCPRCKEMRPIEMFYVSSEARQAHKEGRTRLHRPCRICKRESNMARIQPRRDLMDQVKADRGCAECGLVMPDHPEVFDFDHAPGSDKLRHVADFATKGTIEELLAEIAKCEVVCANCHRIRTRAREPLKFGRDSGPRE